MLYRAHAALSRSAAGPVSLARGTPVRLLVTVQNADGSTLTTYYPDLTLGEPQRITVPCGAATVILSRPVRTRIRLVDRRHGTT